MIGAFNHRITFQVLTITQEPGGGASESWEDELTTWAQVSPLKPSRLLQDNQIVLKNGYTITVRWANGRIIDKARRIIYNGETLTINGVFPEDAEKKFYQITAIT